MTGFDINSSQPAARSEGAKIWCPYCGSETAIVSMGDVPDDRGRMQLYCNNSYCDVREFEVIAFRAGPDAPERADVLALQTLDEGTPAERAQYGHDSGEMKFPGGAEEQARMKRWLEDRPKLRTRPTTIEVTVHDDWSAAHQARLPAQVRP